MSNTSERPLSQKKYIMKKFLLLAALVFSLTTMVNARNNTSRYSDLANKRVAKTEYMMKVQKRNKVAKRRYAKFVPVTNHQVHKNLAKAKARIAKNTSLSRNSRGYQAQMAMRGR